MKRWLSFLLLIPALGAPTASAAGNFTDVTDAAGLGAPLFNSYVHAGAWGDIDGNDWPDLLAGTFVSGPTVVPNQLLLNDGAVFMDSAQASVETDGRSAGAVFADLDGDGDDDLFLSNNRKSSGSGAAAEPSHLYRNDGGVLVDVSAGSGVEVQSSNGRQVGVLDYNGDELLDLFVVADYFAGGGPSVLLRNDGGLHFTDVTAIAGLPTTVRGLGMAIGDVTGDGWTDLFVAGGPSFSDPNTNYLFVANGDGTFRSVADHGLDWTPFATGAEDWVSSGAFGDVDRDGRLDLLIGHHFGSASVNGPGVPIRLYMNRGLNGNGDPIFEDVTSSVGLPAIDSKAPHVDIQDFDNDGWQDLYVSVTVGGQPIIFFNSGVGAGQPSFAIPSIDDPHYYPVGPVADFDLDGRLDVFLGEFRSVYQGTPNDEGVVPSLLLANRTAGGNWLDVRIDAPGKGVGYRVAAYVAGQIGVPAALLGYAEIAIGSGFSSTGLPVAHFGLGVGTAVDLVVTAPGGGGSTEVLNVAVNQRLSVLPNHSPPPDPLAPAAWWPLDETSGTQALDASGNGNHGTVVGGVSRIGGKVGGALSLGGGGQRIEVPAAVLNGVEAVSLTGWISTSSTGLQWLVGGAVVGDASSFDMKVRRGTRVMVTTGGGATLSWVVPSLADAAWHHLALVRDAAGDTMTLYVDGLTYGTKPSTLAPPVVTTLGIGADQRSAGTFTSRSSWVGGVDDFRIYNRALSAAEVATLAES